jgi:hypothetical protein
MRKADIDLLWSALESRIGPGSSDVTILVASRATTLRPLLPVERRAGRNGNDAESGDCFLHVSRKGVRRARHSR